MPRKKNEDVTDSNVTESNSSENAVYTNTEDVDNDLLKNFHEPGTEVPVGESDNTE